jgi:DNA-binding response OmpR family regulator
MTFTHGRTILIVDDNQKVREFLQGFFGTNGFESLVAADGREALRLISEHDVSVALLDINMPGLSGIDVLRQLRADSPHTATVMLTASENLRTGIEAMKLGAYDYITKPPDLTDLRNRVEEALKKRAREIQREHHMKVLEEATLRRKRELRDSAKFTINSLVARKGLGQS